jgi:hypothetical protein
MVRVAHDEFSHARRESRLTGGVHVGGEKFLSFGRYVVRGLRSPSAKLVPVKMPLAPSISSA